MSHNMSLLIWGRSDDYRRSQQIYKSGAGRSRLFNTGVLLNKRIE